MSSSVQAAHPSYQHHTIHSHPNHAQYQELSEMTSGTNANVRIMDVHPVTQPLVTTASSRQVSEDSISSVQLKEEGIKARKDVGIEKKITHDPANQTSSSGSDQASVITPRDTTGDRDCGTAVITDPNNTLSLSSSSAKTPILGDSNSSNNGKTSSDNVVHQAASTSIVSPSKQTPNSTLPSKPQVSANGDTADVVVSSTGSSNNDIRPIVSSESTASTSTTTTHTVEDRSSPTTVSTAGTKRKMSLTADGSFSPTTVLSTGTTSRRDSLPMGLRNKKMKATDCLLFAATLLEQDAALGLVAARNSPRTDTIAPVLSQAKVPFVPPAIQKLPVKKTKPLKKMVCEKIERSLQEVAKQQQQQQQKRTRKQEQERDEDGDSANKPQDADVLCGRGGKVNKHPGNIVYRKVVEYNKSYYQSVHKKHRILVSQSIVKSILNYGGRFMGQKGKEWTPICFKRAVQKTSQALRER